MRQSDKTRTLILASVVFALTLACGSYAGIVYAYVPSVRDSFGDTLLAGASAVLVAYLFRSIDPVGVYILTAIGSLSAMISLALANPYRPGVCLAGMITMSLIIGLYRLIVSLTQGHQVHCQTAT